MDWLFEGWSSHPISKILMISTATLSVLRTCDIIKPEKLIFDKEAILKRHEYFRIITSPLSFGDLSIQTIFDFISLIFVLRDFEGNIYISRPLDFILLLMLCFGSTWFVGFRYGVANLYSYFFSFLNYVNIKLNPTHMINIGPFRVRYDYVSFFFLLTDLLLELTEFSPSLVNILFAHIYVFMMIVNQRWQKSIFRFSQRFNHATSDFLRKLM